VIPSGGRSTFDVAILGTGMSGSIVATILARCGVSVVMIDPKTHPRFTIGESTIPHTSLLLAILAERYGVPELDHLAYPDRIARHVATTCGIKRSFGFVYHRPGAEHDRRESIHFGTSSKDENHLFRQDIDMYLLHAAARYGAALRQGTGVAALDIGREGVRIETTDGETIRARYVVDASGYRSWLSERLGLAEQPTRILHRSRTLFTHMIGVRPFDEGRSPMSLPWEKSTLHHVFDGGWIWIIPFGNQETSTNPLVSVGLTLDPDRHPRPARSPESEFLEVLDRFPSVAAQLADAKAIRPWTATGRAQYSSRRCVGYRWCLMSHAAGFVDALFSRGLINTIEVIQALLDPLFEALARDDFSEEAFAPVEDVQRRVLDYNDRLVRYTYLSWSDFELFNAWIRVWALGTILAEFRVMNALQDLSASADPAALAGTAPDPVFSRHEDPDYHAFFDRAAGLMDEFAARRTTSAETAARIFALTEEYPFPVLLRVDAMRRAGWLRVDQGMSARSLGFAREGYRWALTNPTTRDLFGNVDTLYRWRARQPDPHLAAAGKVARGGSA
jgi:tetracycline 7-halogenase / FADH2 O2-dependent halogenase